MRCPECNNKESLDDLDDFYYCNDCGINIPKCEKCNSVNLLDEDDHYLCEDCGEANYKCDRIETV